MIILVSMFAAWKSAISVNCESEVRIVFREKDMRHCSLYTQATIKGVKRRND